VFSQSSQAVKGRIIYNLPDLLQAYSQFPEKQYLLQPVNLLGTVYPVSGRSKPGWFQQSDLVIIAQSAAADTCCFSQLLNRVFRKADLPSGTIVNLYVTLRSIFIYREK